jgi:hypothetical protein
MRQSINHSIKSKAMTQQLSLQGSRRVPVRVVEPTSKSTKVSTGAIGILYWYGTGT